MNENTPSPDVDDALVAASPFNLARRAANAIGGAPWGGIRHKYSEAEWVRDRLGRWMKYIGAPWQESWETDSSGRETPTFAHANIFDSRVGTTPRYKGRVVSPKLDDGSVIMEVGNSVRDLGRQETPGEDQWDRISTDLPDHLVPGQSTFARLNPDTMELISDPTAKAGGRGRLTPEERARRGRLGESTRARVGEEVIGEDELNLPEPVAGVPAASVPQWRDVFDDIALQGWEVDPANPMEMWDSEEPTLRLVDDGRGALHLFDEGDPSGLRSWTFDKSDPELEFQIADAVQGKAPTDAELEEMGGFLDELDLTESAPDAHLDEYGEYDDELDVPATDDDVLPDEDRAALEDVLADELDEVLAEEESTGGIPHNYPNIEQANAYLSDIGWTPDPDDPSSLLSPDGGYRALPVTDALGHTFDSMFVEDVLSGEAVLWDRDRGGDFGEWLTEQLNVSEPDRFARGWTEPLPVYTGADDGLSEADRAQAIRSNMFGAVDLDSADDVLLGERNDRMKELMGELAKDENAHLLQRYNDELGGMVGGDAAADVLYEYGWDQGLGSPAEALPRLIDTAGRMVRDDPYGSGPSLRELLDEEPDDELNLPEPGVEDLGSPVPVSRYKPGAHRGERAGRGENRGWISRPPGYRAADFRERDRRRAIEQSVTDDELNLPETATRQTIRDAAVEAGVSDKTLQRIDTAITPEDIIDAVDQDQAIDDEMNIPGVGSDARLAAMKLLAQLGLIDDLDDPKTSHPTASEEELDESAVAAADAARRLATSPGDQIAEIMDFYTQNKHLFNHVARQSFEAVSDKKRADKRPKWQQYVEDLPKFDSLDPDRQNQLLTQLDWARGQMVKIAMRQNEGAENKAAAREVADRLEILVDTLKNGNADLKINKWTEDQQDGDARYAAAEAVMATKTPPRSYRYMDDYKDVTDYDTPDQQIRIQNMVNTLGDVHQQAVDAFGKDSKRARELRELRDDVDAFLAKTGTGPAKDPHREALLERAINRARYAAGKHSLPELEEVRDQLLEIRAEGHGQSLADLQADTSWDIPNEELQAINDALQQFAGKGTTKGKNLLNAAAAIKDIIPGPRAGGAWNEGYAPGTPERWAALMRARNLIDVAHGEQTIPIMHAMGIPVDKRRIRKLLNPKFNLAPENFGSRPDPRGTPWTQADLDVMSDMASRLRKIVEKDTSSEGHRYRGVAKLLDSAVRAYNDQDYGAFEAISEQAMSFLSALNQDTMYQQLGALRDMKHEPNDWNARWDQLEQDLIDIFGKVPTGQGISNPKSNTPTEITQRQKAMALIAEAAKRPQGSIHQRTKLATALWLLNEVNDPKDADLRDALGPYGANGDQHVRQAAPYQPRMPGTATDARIARSQEIAQKIKDEGEVTGDELERAFGLTPERLDGLVEPLINSGVLRLVRRTRFGPVYAMGPNYYVHDPVLEKERPLTRKELDDMVMRALADVAPSPVTPKPVRGHAFVDSRIVKRNLGGPDEDVVIGLGPETTPDRNATAYWDAASGNWVLSTFPVGGWKTFGLPVDESGAEVQQFMSLGSLRYGLSALADLNRIPYPEPVVAAIEPEDVQVEVRQDPMGGGSTVVVVVVDDSDDDDDDDGDDIMVVPVTDYLEPPPEYEEPVYPTQLPVFPGVDQVYPEDRFYPVGEEEIL